METEFVHMPLHHEFEAIGGRYSLVKEDTIEMEGERVLYLVGCGVFDASCCGEGGCAYAVVPGVVKQLRSREDEEGRPVSLVEPVKDEDAKRRISLAIRRRESVRDVNFL